jgi:hypothetical protein
MGKLKADSAVPLTRPAGNLSPAGVRAKELLVLPSPPGAEGARRAGEGVKAPTQTPPELSNNCPNLPNLKDLFPHVGISPRRHELDGLLDPVQFLSDLRQCTEVRQSPNGETTWLGTEKPDAVNQEVKGELPVSVCSLLIESTDR